MSPPSSDRELGALTEAINWIRREMTRDREQRDEEHGENSGKLDQLLGLKPMVESHEAWIKGPGADMHRTITELRGASKFTKALWVVLGAVGFGALYKLFLAVASVFVR
jgi:hypothetical protein